MSPRLRDDGRKIWAQGATLSTKGQATEEGIVTIMSHRAAKALSEWLPRGGGDLWLYLLTPNRLAKLTFIMCSQPQEMRRKGGKLPY